MKTQKLFSILEANKDKALLFEYAPNKFVGANYHITEVKHITIDAIDCGARADSWNETVIQLWESPLEKQKTEHMSVIKALGILKKVGRMKPYDKEAEVKFEYSNTTFHTAQLFVNDFETQNNHLILKLAVEKTDCKAKSVCGIPEKVVEVAEKITEKVEECCGTIGGCC